MNTDRPIGIAYKYLSYDGAIKTITNQSVRFATPAALNDPFDANVESLLGYSPVELVNLTIAEFFRTLSNSPETLSNVLGDSPEQLQMLSSTIQSAPKSVRDQFLNSVCAEMILNDDPQILRSIERFLEDVKLIQSNFRNAAVFCTTRSYKNKLMWAHYAEQHRGVVLGFSPDYENDSFLRLLRPISYSNNRPQFMKSVLDLSLGGSKPTAEELERLWYELLYTKSPEWSYEEETRVVIPNEVPVGQSATFLKYQARELSHLFLGCRMSDTSRNQIIDMARALNPHVEISLAVLANDSYEMKFEHLG